MTRNKPQKSESPEAFRTFVLACEAVFGFLVEDYGFRYLGWKVLGRECATWYVNSPNVTLKFSYEPLSLAFGTVFARLKPDEDRMIKMPLERLARQRIPEWQHPAKGEADTTVDGLSRDLRVYADLLLTTFPEILAAPDGIGVKLQKGLDKE